MLYEVITTQITAEICTALNLKVRILPMTNDKFETKIKTKEGFMHFEEYFVKKQCKDKVLDVQFDGATTAKPSPEVVESILDAETVIVCPSNPIVSIGRITSYNVCYTKLLRLKLSLLII